MPYKVFFHQANNNLFKVNIIFKLSIDLIHQTGRYWYVCKYVKNLGNNSSRTLFLTT